MAREGVKLLLLYAADGFEVAVDFFRLAVLDVDKRVFCAGKLQCACSLVHNYDCCVHTVVVFRGFLLQGGADEVVKFVEDFVGLHDFLEVDYLIEEGVAKHTHKCARHTVPRTVNYSHYQLAAVVFRNVLAPEQRGRTLAFDFRKPIKIAADQLPWVEVDEAVGEVLVDKIGVWQHCALNPCGVFDGRIDGFVDRLDVVVALTEFRRNAFQLVALLGDFGVFLVDFVVGLGEQRVHLLGAEEVDYRIDQEQCHDYRDDDNQVGDVLLALYGLLCHGEFFLLLLCGDCYLQF